MSQYDPKRIEELQMVLLRDPRSPVFATLAETYRRMGLLEEALEVTNKGVKHNPEYVSGLVAHAKVLYELKNFEQALPFLNKAHALKPENILALRLLGHGFTQLKQHKKALTAFKKLLVLIPNDSMAQDFVKKWEFLENIAPASGAENWSLDGYDHWIFQLPSEDHVIHLIDSFMNYGDEENALEIATISLEKWPTSKAIKKRQTLLLENMGPSTEPEENTALNQERQQLKFKKRFYQHWLQRVEQLKTIDP